MPPARPLDPPYFRKLNKAWNADPNVPSPLVVIDDTDLILRFRLNPWQFPRFSRDDEGALRFSKCARYRLEGSNDEGWYMGQCRYSRIAPEWGEFYEISGIDPHRDDPDDWISISSDPGTFRHFLFYLRDDTFECFAAGWTFDPAPWNALLRLPQGK